MNFGFYCLELLGRITSLTTHYPGALKTRVDGHKITHPYGFGRKANRNCVADRLLILHIDLRKGIIAQFDRNIKPS